MKILPGAGMIFKRIILQIATPQARFAM